MFMVFVMLKMMMVVFESHLMSCGEGRSAPRSRRIFITWVGFRYFLSPQKLSLNIAPFFLATSRMLTVLYFLAQ